jgi:hypothetical protein
MGFRFRRSIEAGAVATSRTNRSAAGIHGIEAARSTLSTPARNL